MKVLPFTRDHRTALVADIRRGIDGEFEERVKRLFESVNGPNIKVDIFTLSGDDVLTKGTTIPSASKVATSAKEITLSPGSPFSTEVEAAAATPDSVILEVDQVLADAGYVQVLHVRNVKALH